MALDASIYGNLLGRPARSVQEWESFYQKQDDARLAQEDAKQQRALNALALQLKQGEMQQAQALQQEQSGLSKWLQTADQKAPDFATQALRVAPRAALPVLKQFGDQAETTAKISKENALTAKATAETEREKLTAARERLAMIYNAASGAKDQASYTMALQGLQSQGVDVSALPQQFDPAYVEQAKAQALTQAQRLDQAMKANEFSLKANNELIGPDGKVNNTLLGAKERIAGAGASRVSVGVNTEKTYAGNVAEGLAKNDVSALEAAQTAPDRVRSAQRVIDILNKQAPITGTAAELRLGVNKALSTAGIIDGKSVTATEDLASTLASQTLDAIKTSGLGGGQGFTDKDRQFLERAKSGNIEINADSLRNVARLNILAAKASIERGNKVAARLKGKPSFGTVGQEMTVQMPDEVRMPTAQEIAAEAARRKASRGK